MREAVPGRWLLANIRCDPATSSVVDLGNNQVTITVTGGSVTCTFIDQRKGIIRVQKYNDRNADAQRNRGEPALADWTIRLYDNQQALVAEQVTNMHGKVSFTSLRPGNYTVCEELTAGWVNTQPGLIDPAFSQPCYVLTLGVGQIAQVVFGNSDGLAASSVPSYDDGVFIFSMPDNETDDDNYDAVDTDEEYLNTPDEVSGIYLPLVTR